MPSPETVLGVVLIVALNLYMLLGGADFGGGVWDLLASGPRAAEQRALIEKAIGPIWEANHVWLILAIVVLFVAFPSAFAVLSIALHIPLTLMLIGIVFRGTAFTFRTYDDRSDDAQRRWGRSFAVASLVTPVLLGIVVGAISSGRIRLVGGIVTSGFFASWLAPFPFAVGGFTLAIFAFLAATYLTVEAENPALRDDFRTRALVSAAAVGAMALVVFLLSGEGAPLVRHGLSGVPWAVSLHLATGLLALGTIAALWFHRFHLARSCAVAQVSLILWGWAAAQYPYLIAPQVTLHSAAGPAVTLRMLVIALGLGFLLLLPSFAYLFIIFKGRSAFRVVDRSSGVGLE